MANNDNAFGEVISSYSREQAIEDGVLVPIGDMAKEAGFMQPVCFTRALYSACEDAHGDTDAWLWDVLFMARMFAVPKMKAEAQRSPESVGPIAYTLKLGTRNRKVWLCWNSHEAFTFMFPEDY